MKVVIQTDVVTLFLAHSFLPFTPSCTHMTSPCTFPAFQIPFILREKTSHPQISGKTRSHGYKEVGRIIAHLLA